VGLYECHLFVRRLETEHFRVSFNADAARFEPFGESKHELGGIHVRVVGEIDAADHLRAQGWLVLVRLLRVQHVRAHAKLTQQARFGRAVFQSAPGFEGGQHPLVFIIEIEIIQRGQMLEQLSARHAQVAQDGNPAPHRPVPTGQPKAQDPLEEVQIEAGSHVERALGIEHPLQPVRQRTRRGQRHAVTRNEKSRVAKRTARRNLALLEQCHPCPAFREVVRGTDTDDAATDDEDVR
jgi:hypothetical protein